jgi:hypothetical protein
MLAMFFKKIIIVIYTKYLTCLPITMSFKNECEYLLNIY